MCISNKEDIVEMSHYPCVSAILIQFLIIFVKCHFSIAFFVLYLVFLLSFWHHFCCLVAHLQSHAAYVYSSFMFDYFFGGTSVSCPIWPWLTRSFVRYRQWASFNKEPYCHGVTTGVCSQHFDGSRHSYTIDRSLGRYQICVSLFGVHTPNLQSLCVLVICVVFKWWCSFCFCFVFGFCLYGWNQNVGQAKARVSDAKCPDGGGAVERRTKAARLICTASCSAECHFLY